MKVLWVGDAVVSSGFARCTHVACDALHAAGHDVRVLGLNYYGDPHDYPYPIHPCYQPLDHGRDGFGVGRLPHFVNRYEPDVVVLLNDPWNVPGYVAALSDKLEADHPIPNLVGWLAVDSQNQQGAACEDLDLIVTWTKFAQRELSCGGYTGPFALAPLGVDRGNYRPLDRMQSRRFLGPLADRVGEGFLVGAVGRNQTRKRLDLTIRYFARWVADHRPDAYLYLHVGPTGDTNFDLESLSRYYGVLDRVIVGRAALGSGAEEWLMPTVYSMLDLYISTSQGEGWGLPALEAMACGVPCILPDWAAFSEWPGDAVVLVACTSTCTTAPTNGRLHTIGGIADERSFVEELSAMYDSRSHWQTYRDRGLRRAKDFDWSRTGAALVAAIESLPPSSRVAGDLGRPRSARAPIALAEAADG